MAITLADFTKIWASTSPLTPYSFSDANYQEGWNFVGSTPPARQMWDSYMKFSDEKQQYIVQNFLPLSGGTMTGGITTSATDFIVKTNNTTHLTIAGGSAYSNSASLRLAGGEETGQTGLFQLRAQDGVNSKDFIGKTDGTLTWNGKTVQTSSTFSVEATETTYSLAGNTSGEFYADVSKNNKTILGIVSIRNYSTVAYPVQWWMEDNFAHVYFRNPGTTAITNNRLVFFVLYATT